MKTLLLLTPLGIFLLAVMQQSSWADNAKTLRKIKIRVTHIDHREVITNTEYIVQAPTQVVAGIVMEGVDQWSEYVPGYPYSQLIGHENVRRILSAHPKKFQEVLKLVSEETTPPKGRMTRNAENEITFYILQQVKLPWPISKRWSLAQAVYQPQAMDGANPSYRPFIVEYETLVGDLVKGKGRWEVRPDENHPGWSVAFNEHILDFGVQVPSFIVKLFSKKIALEIHEALRERAEQEAKNTLARNN